MIWEDIEKELAKKSRQEQVNVDTEGMWKAIQPHIPVEKKNNRIIFLILFGIIMLASTFTLFLSQKKEPLGENVNYTHNQQIHTGIEEVDQAKDELNVSPTVENTALTKPSSEKQLNTTFSTNPEKLSENHNSTLVKHSQFSLSNSKKTESNLDQRKDLNITIEKTLNNQKFSVNIENLNVLDQTLSTSELTTGHILGEKQLDRQATLRSNSQISTPLLYINRIAPLSIMQLERSKTISILEPHTYNKTSLLIDKSISWYIELAGGLSFGHDNLSVRNGDWTNHLNTRIRAESSLLSYNGSFSIGARITNHWSVQTGLRLTNRYKRSKSTINFSDMITLDDVVLQEIQTADGLQTIRGNTIVMQETTRTVQRINRFRTIEIPLELLYTHQFRNIGWDLGINLATTINHSMSGYIHPTSDREYNLAEDPNNWFDNKQLWSSSLIGGVRLNIWPSGDLFGRLRYQHYWNSITSDNYGIIESYSGMHLEIGTRINF